MEAAIWSYIRLYLSQFYLMTGCLVLWNWDALPDVSSDVAVSVIPFILKEAAF